MAWRPHPDQAKAKSGEKIIAEFLEFKTLQENWSEYELQDGTRIRARVVLDEAYIPRDPQTDEIIRREDGAPTYGVSIGVRVIFEPSETVIVPLKTEKKG